MIRLDLVRDLENYMKDKTKRYNINFNITGSYKQYNARNKAVKARVQTDEQ